MSKFSDIGVSENFSSGASYLISEMNYKRFLCRKDAKTLGRPDAKGDSSLFVAPNNEITKMLEDYPKNPRKWEEKLGLPEDSLSDRVYRIDIDKPLDYNLSVSKANTPGSNSMYVDAAAKGELPHTSGGISEGVLINADNPVLKDGVGKTSCIYTPDMAKVRDGKMSLGDCKGMIKGMKNNNFTKTPDVRAIVGRTR